MGKVSDFLGHRQAYAPTSDEEHPLVQPSCLQLKVFGAFTDYWIKAIPPFELFDLFTINMSVFHAIL
jgi:hypothetical protein